MLDCGQQWLETDAAILNAVYWGSFSVGRIAAVLLSSRIRVHTMLVVHMSTALCAMVGLAASVGLAGDTPSDSTAQRLMLGTAVFGFALGPIFPSTLLLVEKYIEISGRAASVIMVGAALGEMAVPAILARPALLRSWANLQAHSQTRIRQSAC